MGNGRTRIALLGVVLVILGGLVVAWRRSGTGGSGGREDAGDRIRVVASFYPLAEFARRVGGDRAEVVTIVPPGGEPHGFEPTPQDIITLTRSRLFLANGGGMDPWAERIRPELERRGVAVVVLHDRVAASDRNPHLWLDPVLAQQEVEVLRDALADADPAHAGDYARNASETVAMLDRLAAEYRDGLAVCRVRALIVSHDAFGHLGRRYGLEVLAVAGLSPDEEPSPRRLGELAALAQERGIRHVFFETLASPRIAETLAREIGAETLVLNPLEGLTPEERAAGEDYFSIMRKNLENLRAALDCAPPPAGATAS